MATLPAANPPSRNRTKVLRWTLPLAVFLVIVAFLFVGLNYKDEPKDGLAWLAERGDPYKTSIVDRDGRVGIDFGVYGVPETFVIDKTGVIRYKQIGPLTSDALDGTILPLVRKLQQS